MSDELPLKNTSARRAHTHPQIRIRPTPHRAIIAALSVYSSICRVTLYGSAISKTFLNSETNSEILELIVIFGAQI